MVGKRLNVCATRKKARDVRKLTRADPGLFHFHSSRLLYLPKAQPTLERRLQEENKTLSVAERNHWKSRVAHVLE